MRCVKWLSVIVIGPLLFSGCAKQQGASLPVDNSPLISSGDTTSCATDGSEEEDGKDGDNVNDGNYLSSVTHTVEEQKITEQYLLLKQFPAVSTIVSTFSRVDEEYGVEYYREMQEDHSYAVFQTDTGGAFIIYFGDSKAYSHAVYLKELLAYSDFAALKIGDNIERVADVDGVAGIYRELFAAQKSDKITVHLLLDGVLVIGYDDNLAIRSMDFFEDYKAQLPLAVGTCEFDYSIDREDFALGAGA